MKVMLANFAISAISAMFAITLAACAADPKDDPRATPEAVAPAAVTLDLGRTDLVFRYLDPKTGEVATATSPDAIPEAARRQVVVYDALAAVPAGWDLVADLGATPVVAQPREHFAFATRAALTPSEARPPDPSAANAAQHEVVLFSTAGCGYCAKARKFLTKNQIPFTELDIEDNPAAPGRLSALGQRAGLSAGDMQGVPIIFVDGKPILGWDQRRLSSLLGLGS